MVLARKQVLKTRSNIPYNPQKYFYYPEKKWLSHTPWFKSFVRRNSGIIGNFLQARRKILAGRRKVKIGKLAVERLERPGFMHSEIYRASIGRKVFFIKEQNEKKQMEGFRAKLDLAQPQIQALEKAGQILEDFNRRNGTGIKVETVKYHLAWTQGKSSFLVTDYYEGERFADNEELWKGPIGLLAGEAFALLAKNGFIGASKGNAMWVPRQRKIVLFDFA